MSLLKPTRSLHGAARALAVICAALAAPAWAGIPQLSGFEAVRIWEITYYTQTVDFAAGDSRLTQVLTGTDLSGTQRDFGFFPGDENYDIYFSDANGVLDPNGTHITVDGNCFVPYNCFNLNEVALVVNGQVQYSTGVVRSVYGRAGSFWADSAAYAGDGDLNTFTALGDTIGLPADARMSVTLAFDGVPAVPEPGTWVLMAGGLLLIGLRRQR
ncbi:MAG: PEP-CTERM sorting domain-containing protein [Rhodoferax sp.]|nr:PEP-CTERM sorting domain-containing protein [Rhodoferax sp.]